MKQKIEWFLSSNDAAARLGRTILEAILGIVVANIDLFFSGFTIPSEYKTLIVGAVVAIVSPILASLKAKNSEIEEQSEVE